MSVGALVRALARSAGVGLIDQGEAGSGSAFLLVSEGFCPARHAWIVSPETWLFSSAVRSLPCGFGRCSTPREWPSSCSLATSTGSFFQMRFGEAESVPAVMVSLAGRDFHMGCCFYYL